MALCEICQKEFKQKRYLQEHMRVVHHVLPISDGKLKCSFCSNKFKFYSQLRDHFVDAHNKEIFKEVKIFKTEEEFVTWKDEKEKEMKCLYVQYTGPQKLSKTKTKTYFICHRTSRQICEVKEDSKRKRQVRSQGIEKLQYTCPSTMEFCCENGQLKAVLFTPHIGHDCSLKFVNLTKAERKEIAGKISQGNSFDKILDDIRNNINKSDSTERIHLLNRQDLRNIEREFSLNRSEGLYQFIVQQNHQNSDTERLVSKLDTLHTLCSSNSLTVEIKAKLDKMLDVAISLVKSECPNKPHQRLSNEPSNKR